MQRVSQKILIFNLKWGIQIRSYFRFHTGLQFESAWDLVGPKDKQRLLSLKTSLSIENDGNELDDALEFFKQSVHDFPGEHFLQSPFIFVVRKN